jgi:hypothetical protein
VSLVRSGQRRIRDDCAVEFSFDTATRHFQSEWDPGIPRRLSEGEFALYRSCRDQFLEQIASVAGIRILMVDL